MKKVANYTSILAFLLQIACLTCNLRATNSEPVPLLLYESEQQVNGSERLTQILSRVGPNIRASSDFHDYSDQTVEDSLIAWSGFERQAREYAQAQVDFYLPKISSLLASANVSAQCRESTNLTLAAIRQLDSWATQMWNSMGNFPPAGLLDGQLNDLGSYHNCVDLKVSDKRINNTNYCTLAFRPIVPSRRPFHMVFEKENERLLKLFNGSNIISAIADRAHYFHYIYVKTAICAPIQCSPEDMQQVALLIARRWFLATGPVKCFTRGPVPSNRKASKLDRLIFDEIENEPIWIKIEGRQLNAIQTVALVLVVIFFGLVLIASLWHWLEICTNGYWSCSYVVVGDLQVKQQAEQFQINHQGLIKQVAFNYLSVITNGREFLDTRWKSNEITCLHGLRVFTMIWIITVHCLQYNEWSGFTRAFENEATLKNPILHPIYNANYVVDNFFFMSGLLASFSSWNSHGKNQPIPHSIRTISNIINRYLRLTPQVLLVSMLYVLLPLKAHGPFWYDMTEQAGKYCEKNWWINLLHLQAFYREDEMCNLVGWWISVDMFFYLTALLITYLVLTNRRTLALQSTVAWVLCCTIVSASKHYHGHYPPNNLGTIPQASEVWTRYVVNYFWSPFTHAYPFYSGLWVGYMLANNKWRQEVQSWSCPGTIMSAILLLSINMSSHIWMSGFMEIGSQWISTAYNCICPILWINGLAWFVIACHYGCMPNVNKILSSKLFVLLSKASFIIYLSHMLVLRLFFGSQVTLLEVSPLSLSFIVVGNAFLSIVFGVFLCITFEGPSMKLQKLVTNYIRAKSQGVTQSSATDLKQVNVC